MNALQRLVGQTVINGEANEGAMGLVLSDAVLAVYNPASGATPSECVGSAITSVQLIERESFTLSFSNGKALRISLEDDDYAGPEAFSVRFKDGTLVVGQ